MLPIRSLLFAPGNKPEIVQKAIRSGADSVIFELEDAVPVGAKEEARAALEKLPPPGVPLFVRVNGYETEWIWPDLLAAARARPAGVIVPKVESPDAMREIGGALSVLEAANDLPHGCIPIVPIIETARGVVAVREIARVDRVEGLFFGSGEQGDLVADLGCEWTPEGTALLHARAECVLAARAAGHDTVIDGVFMDVRNPEAFERECRLARTLGYTAKALIHPNQVALTHRTFTPSNEEVERQREIIRRYEEALAEGDGSIAVDGKLIDYAVIRVAQRIIRQAEAAHTAERRLHRD